MIIRRCMYTALVAASLCMCLTSTSDAAMIGPGASIAAGTLDNGASINFEGRLNISQEFTNLAAGSYNVNSFSWRELEGSTNADLQPFLATLNPGPNPGRIYTILWAGPIGTGTGGAGVYTVNYMGESFSLGAATDVYAGFNQQANIIPFSTSNIGANTDHQGSEFGADFSLMAGDQYPNSDPWSNPNLAREYAFDIDVEPSAAVVPEPGSLAVFAIGAVGIVGMGVRRRKNRQA